jgi:hypothetical protein
MGFNKYPQRGANAQTLLTMALAAGPTLTADQAQAEILHFTGTAGALTVQFPFVAGSAVGTGEAGKWYLVNNATNGNLTFKGYASDGTTPTTGVALTAAKMAIAYWNGTDFIAFYQQA